MCRWRFIGFYSHCCFSSLDQWKNSFLEIEKSECGLPSLSFHPMTTTTKKQKEKPCNCCCCYCCCYGCRFLNVFFPFLFSFSTPSDLVGWKNWQAVFVYCVTSITLNEMQHEMKKNEWFNRSIDEISAQILPVYSWLNPLSWEYFDGNIFVSVSDVSLSDRKNDRLEILIAIETTWSTHRTL